LEGISWLFAASKQPRPWLDDLTPDNFVIFSDHILGETVAGINFRTADVVVIYPSWDLILSYETALRKEAFKKVKSGSSLAQSLLSVCGDTQLRDLHFIEPFRLHTDRCQSSSSPIGGGKGSGFTGAPRSASQSAEVSYSSRSYSKGKPSKGFGNKNRWSPGLLCVQQSRPIL
jgi:hypothetical protein